MSKPRIKSAQRLVRGIGLHGFKCFRDPQTIALAKLTVLAGTNSAGKSSVMQPLLLMKQTLESPYDPGPLLLDGPLVHVENAQTLFWKGKANKDVATEWSVTVDGPRDAVRTTFGHVKERLAVLRVEKLDTDRSVVWSLAEGPDVPRELRDEANPNHRQRAAHDRFRFVLVTDVVAPDRSTVRIARRPSVELRNELFNGLIHVPGSRGNPERAYRLALPGPTAPGPFVPYVAGTLAAWKESSSDQLTGVGEDLRRLGVSWKVDPRRRTDTHVEIHIGRLPAPQQGGSQDLVNIADVGFGASQVLPVVVALRAAGPGRLVHIEQPELHLHPRAQVAMASILADAVARGVQVVVETHSAVLLKALQALVADGGGLEPEDVTLHWFERDESGATHVRSGDLDGTGAYGDWPVDFTDVELEVESRLIRAAFG